MNPSADFSGRCPECQSHDSHVKSQVVTYDAAFKENEKVASTSRFYLCNFCGHDWFERIGDDVATEE